MKMKSILFLVVCMHLSALCTALYCEPHNCYELLEVTRDATQTEIRKAYRKQAIRYHPDKNKEKGAREMFESISTAYEILKDEEERGNYNYMLDHPEEVYGHYYRYYRRRTPRIDVRLILISGILIVSVLQYLGWWHSYNTAVSAALRMPKYRTKAKEIAVSRGLVGQRRRKGGKEEEEGILRTIVEENLDITPYTLVMYMWWYGRWVWLFTIMKNGYGPEEIVYLTKTALKLSATHWEALESNQKEEFISRELWIKDNLAAWRKEQLEEQRMKYAGSSKHKMYRRYMKNHNKSAPSMVMED